MDPFRQLLCNGKKIVRTAVVETEHFFYRDFFIALKIFQIYLLCLNDQMSNVHESSKYTTRLPDQMNLKQDGKELIVGIIARQICSTNRRNS